ncbi:MAG: tryptophan synthase subunit beta, partial [Myxococcota bacterium]
PLYRAARLSEQLGVHIWLKREDLCHTGAHKVNNTLGQVLLAKRMGKKRVIAETGAGQHGVATATACALLNLPCAVFMGAEDVRRQMPNVHRMELMGAEVIAVESGSRTLKDAMNEALRHWVTHVETTAYCVGSVAGPHPYPSLVKDFQSVIGHEARKQIMAQANCLPSAVIACVGGGSNAMGIFAGFLGDKEVELVGVEAAGCGIETGKHAAPLSAGTVGVLHGARSYVLQNEDGQIEEAHSVSAGLDYPGVGPEHAHLRDSGRAKYVAVTDQEALDAFQHLCRMEGILAALETSHAFAYLENAKREYGPGSHLLVCCSGRGDKDLDNVRKQLKATEPPAAGTH